MPERSLEQRVQDLETRMASHDGNYVQLVNERVRPMENRFDTGDSPWWKLLLFRIDGFGPWWQHRPVPRWRPWRRWFTS